MAWELEIHTIDVGQGESSLIIARDPTNAARHRTMLIDGGLAGYASTVHAYLTAKLGPLGFGLDHILASHYDKDHSGGLTALLVADNLYRVCETIAGPVNSMAATGRTRQESLAFGACTAAAVMRGGYAMPGGYDDSDQVTRALDALKNKTIPKADKAAADLGIDVARREVQATNPSLAKTVGPARLNSVARAAGIEAADWFGYPGDHTAAIRRVVFEEMSTGVPVESRFSTGGAYAATHVIDIGQSTHISLNYTNAIRGTISLDRNTDVAAPGLVRSRTSLGQADPGREILWNTGAGSSVADANGPAVFVVACDTFLWNGGSVKRTDNNEGIALIVRFNNFAFYTGGDLESVGEDVIAQKVMTIGLPNPVNGHPLPIPDRIAAFKCGHHGSDHSTSQTFLNRAKPRAAMISCHKGDFGYPGAEDHPSEKLITRLHRDPSITYFYLTNCYYQRKEIPATKDPPSNQLNTAGNKSRLSGDNSDINKQAGRHRGDIALGLNQAESQRNPGDLQRQYHVRYYDDDGPVQNFRIEDVAF